MKNFTEEDVIREAAKIIKGGVCLDFIDDAMQESTLEKAVEVIVSDTEYWNYLINDALPNP